MLTKTCEEFLEVLSTNSPTPGGGSASALVGAMGCALGMMVGNLTVGKKKYERYEADILELNAKARGLMYRMEELVKRDAEAFEPLAEAYKMPKDTPEQIAEREKAMETHLGEAAMVPLEISKCCLEALKLVRDYALKGSIMAISDAGCAATFLKAALGSAKLNVLINTRLIKNEMRREAMEKEIKSISYEGDRLADRIFLDIEARLECAP
ncbi:MAG: cyclodeaminase/cyclohydrolase family protein [Lachnospiraceae bacterium]|nr:cyclodeaminase/cyclohydrolase family protein [Lachnospiraceae bacterium]